MFTAHLVEHLLRNLGPRERGFESVYPNYRLWVIIKEENKGNIVSYMEGCGRGKSVKPKNRASPLL